MSKPQDRIFTVFFLVVFQIGKIYLQLNVNPPIYLNFPLYYRYYPQRVNYPVRVKDKLSKILIYE